MDSLDLLLKLAAAADPGSQAMAAAAQTAGSMPGTVAAPAMPAPEAPADNSADLMRLQKEVGRRDKEIADLRAKVQDAKNQAALTEMKQQMSNEREKMRDELRKEYTQMQDKLRGQQKELDARQAKFVQEEASHKSRLAQIASGHKATLQQQIAEQKSTLQQQLADQQVALAKNEAKSLKDIASMQSKSQQQQTQAYVAMTEKARRDADRMMAEKEHNFAAKHPVIHPTIQGRIDDATSAIARLSKKKDLGFYDGVKLATAAPAQAQQQQPQPQQQPQQQQPQQPRPQQQQAPAAPNTQQGKQNSGNLNTAQRLSRAYTDHGPSTRMSYEQFEEMRRRDRHAAIYDMQFGANSKNVADAEMGIARAENAMARAKAEGNTQRAQQLQMYINQRKDSARSTASANTLYAKWGDTDAKTDMATAKAQRATGWFGDSELDKVRNQYTNEQNDKNRSWFGRALKGIWDYTGGAVVKGIDDATRAGRVNDAFDAKSNFFSGGTANDSKMQGAYDSFMDRAGLPQSWGARFMRAGMPVADLALDAAAVAATIGTGGAAAPALMARMAAKKGLSHAIKTIGVRAAKGIGTRALKHFGSKGARAVGKGITSAVGGFTGLDGSNYGQVASGMGTTGYGQYDSRSGQYMGADGTVRSDSIAGGSNVADVLARRQLYGI